MAPVFGAIGSALGIGGGAAAAPALGAAAAAPALGTAAGLGTAGTASLLPAPAPGFFSSIASQTAPALGSAPPAAASGFNLADANSAIKFGNALGINEKPQFQRIQAPQAPQNNLLQFLQSLQGPAVGPKPKL